MINVAQIKYFISLTIYRISFSKYMVNIWQLKLIYKVWKITYIYINYREAIVEQKTYLLNFFKIL